MSSRRSVVLVCALGLAVIGAYAWHANRAPQTAKPVAAGLAAPALPAQSGPVAVEVAQVRTVSLANDVSAVGTLVSNESVVLRPEVSGRILAIRFQDGQAVKRGAVLIEFDAAVQRAELQQARASLSLAESNFNRSEDLFARKFVSQSGLDTARSQLEVARAAVALAQARYERMQIRAPFDGVLGIRNVSPGDFVKDGEALVNLEDIATLKVDFRLPELYLGRIRPGQALEVSSDVVAGETFTARVEAIDPLVDASGRAVLLRASLDNAARKLRPGVFARVRLILEERPSVLVVPEESLVPAPGGVQLVYQVADGKALRTEVRTGMRRGGVVEVVSGLEADALVVTAGQLKLRDGAPVSIVLPAAVAAGRPG